MIRVTYQVYANSMNITEYDRLICLLVNDVQGFGITSGQIFIVGIAYDRFIAVYKPVKYSRNTSNIFLFFIGILGCFWPIFLTTLKHWNLDRSKKIHVCSVGAASSNTLAPVNTGFSTVFIISLYSK